MEEEVLELDKITDYLRNNKEDDGTFYGCIYNLQVLMGIKKGVNDINMGNGTPLEDYIKERKEIYESYSRKFG
ncbi:MAG: hypothetical protein IJ809_07040 [Clostridia bacterium]|nr:hypothetical protein [Clostridia bacterium]